MTGGVLLTITSIAGLVVIGIVVFLLKTCRLCGNFVTPGQQAVERDAPMHASCQERVTAMRNARAWDINIDNLEQPQ